MRFLDVEIGKKFKIVGQEEEYEKIIPVNKNCCITDYNAKDLTNDKNVLVVHTQEVTLIDAN